MIIKIVLITKKETEKNNTKYKKLTLEIGYVIMSKEKNSKILWA